MPDDSSADDRLDRIEARLDRLESAVEHLRAVVAEGWDEETAAQSSQDRTRASEEREDKSSSDDGSSRSSTPTAPSTETSRSGAASGEEAQGEEPAAPSSPVSAPSTTESAQGGILTSGLASEDWLSYVGIGLLLFGLVFLFKYSIEQGWLVPVVRVGFGALTGSVLLGAGLRVYADRRGLRQVLLGGSSASFYGTIFAAYQLYGLVAYPVAFVGMVAVTVVSIALALRQDHASMAIIGTIGGLGTPFLLYTDVGAVGGFAGYTVLVLAGACAVYLYRGWRSLLYTTVVGGWAVLLVPCVDVALTEAQPDGLIGLQVGLGAAWLLLGGAPVLRTWLRRRSAVRGPQALLGRLPVYGLVCSAPFVALFATRLLWDGGDLLWAAVAAAGMGGYGAAYAGLRRVPLPRYAPAHGLVAAVLAAYGLSEALGGASLLVAWAVQAILLLVGGRRLDDTLLRRAGHALFGLVGGRLLLRFLTLEPGTVPFVSPAALSELAVLGIGAFALRWIRAPWCGRLYRGVLVVGWFGWWTNELLPLALGPTYLLLVGGLTAVALLAYARRRGDLLFRYAGHATSAVLAVGLAVRWAAGPEPEATPVLGLASLSELFVIGLGALVGWQIKRGRERRFYQNGVLVGWLGWWAHELIPLPNGHAYVSLIWGLTAALLLLGGAWRRHDHVQKAGLATLAVFVAKLFLIDLAALSALWRIALFLGAGGGFLLISYSLPGLGASAPDESGA